MIDNIKSIASLPSGNILGETSLDAATSLAAGTQATQGTGTQMSFAQVMGETATGMAESLKLSEMKSFEAVQGKASTREVVDAVMNAEQALQTAIAIRDKVVTAYLEVSRMQI